MTVRLKGVTDEDFVNYKMPSMFVAFAKCDFKCEKESGEPCCQNSSLASSPDISISISNLVERYLKNDVTHAIVFGGLEPFDQFPDLLTIIRVLRMNYHCGDTVVIYTGYYPQEIWDEIVRLGQYDNIIIKYGRFVPGRKAVFDKLLGVRLSSDNQYAVKIS